MGYWGVKSFENDAAADAIDAAMESVHGDRYNALMDDRNATPFEQVQKELANPATLAAAVASLCLEVGSDRPFDDWDETERLGVAGIIVRHAEFGVPIPDDWLSRAIDWLDSESLDWDDETTIRRLRRQKELALLRSLKPAT